MADFRNVDATDFTGWSTGEVRAFARALSSSGVAADARAIATAGEKLADSIAELERDAAAIGTRWQGEARDGSYAVIGQYAAQSYETGAAVTQLVGRVQSLSSTASSTKSRFGELPDPPRGETTSGGATQRAALAAELGRTYTAPVKSSASAMPLSEAGQLVSFVGVGPPLVRRDRSGTVESPEADAGPSQPVGGPGTPVGSGADPTGAVDVPDGGVGARTDAGTGSTGTGTGTEDGAGSGTRTGGESGSPAGAGTAGAGTGGGAAPSGGAGQAPGGAEETGATGLDDPAATEGAPSGSLLMPAASLPGTPAVRTSSGGVGGGVRVPEGGRTASPLGLRQDAAALRASGGGGPGPVTQTGARPTSGPYGMPPAGAAGQRGQGDGRHRVPAYLIDKRNGEELVGELPLVGPGVIGQWRTDGAPDPRSDSRPDAPVRGAPRPR